MTARASLARAMRRVRTIKAAMVIARERQVRDRNDLERWERELPAAESLVNKYTMQVRHEARP